MKSDIETCPNCGHKLSVDWAYYDSRTLKSGFDVFCENCDYYRLDADDGQHVIKEGDPSKRIKR